MKDPWDDPFEDLENYLKFLIVHIVTTLTLTMVMAIGCTRETIGIPISFMLYMSVIGTAVHGIAWVKYQRYRRKVEYQKGFRSWRRSS